MITKVKIDGYKSFSDLSVELSPLTIIAGANGVGKSNFFDALRHVSKLVDLTLRESFETDRGSFMDLFTIYPDGSRANKISYEIEMLLPRSVTDSFGKTENLKYLRLRYEISISLNEIENRLVLNKESLSVIRRSEDEFLKKYRKFIELPEVHGGKNSFIETIGEIINISQDGRGGGKRSYNALTAQRSVISSVTTAEFPHALACRILLENILFLQLNPEKLREPTKIMGSNKMSSDGEYLAGQINRIKSISPRNLISMSKTLSAIVPSVREVDVKVDEKREEYVLHVSHIDGYDISSKLLSDGTLRILALLAVRYDPEFGGTIIFEEPENGIHPGRIQRVIKLLRTMTDIEKHNGNRQIIVNTHSTKVLGYATYNEIAMAMMTRRKTNKNGVFASTSILPVDDSLFPDRPKIARFALNEVLENDKEIALVKE